MNAQDPPSGSGSTRTPAPDPADSSTTASEPEGAEVGATALAGDDAEVGRESDDDELESCADPSTDMASEHGNDEPPSIEERLADLEERLIGQEHRIIPIVRDLWNHDRSSSKWRQAAKAGLRVLFSASPLAAAGASGIAVMGLIIAWQANLKLEAQNTLIIAQNEKVTEANEIGRAGNELMKAQNKFFQRQIQQQAVQEYRSRRAELVTTVYNRRQCWDGEKPTEGRADCPRASIEAREAAARSLVEIESALRADPDSWPGVFVAERTNLNRADLAGTVFLEADLGGTEFIKANLRGANFIDADLSNAILGYAELSDAYLNNAKLPKADLRNTRLRGASLAGTYMVGAILSGADLDGAFLHNANLSGVELSGANLSGATLSGANLNRTRFNPASPPRGLTQEQLAKAKNVPTKFWELVGGRPADAPSTP